MYLIFINILPLIPAEKAIELPLLRSLAALEVATVTV